MTKKIQVAVVEDDARIRAGVSSLLEGKGYEVFCASSAEEFVDDSHSSRQIFDLLILDIRLPGMSGVELAGKLAGEGTLPPTVIISGEATVAEAVAALRHGAYDFLEKPFSEERLVQTVHNALEASGLRRKVEQLRELVADRSRLMGDAPAMRRLRELIDRSAAIDCGVLILGESGSGKELVADALYEASARSDGPFVKVNCAALPPNLIEDTIFGHVRGAFTDARSDRTGVFEEADGGTLFLDEIGEMDTGLQTRLLRVLEDGIVRRLGGTRDIVVDVRVVAATNRDLEAEVAEKRFRDDLYYRLAQLVIEVPALRERPQDVMMLFCHFLMEISRRYDRTLPKIAPETEDLLIGYPWPGNVRELKNLCHRLVVVGDDPVLPKHLPGEIRSPTLVPRESHVREGASDQVVPLRTFRNRCEREYIRAVLERARWNYTRAAKILEVQRTYLHRKAAQLGINRPQG